MDVTIWQKLGIEATSDKKIIKRAYASKLRQLIPDEHPKEFQELKMAFDQALKEAKAINESSKVEMTQADESLIEAHEFFAEENLQRDNEDYSVEVDKRNDGENYSFEVDDYYENEDPIFEAYQEKKSFPLELTQLTSTTVYCYSLEAWENVLQTINDWSIDEYMSNRWTIQEFLVNNYRWLSKEIIHYLFQEFQLLELDDQISQERLVYYPFISNRKKIYTVPPFTFEVAKKIEYEKMQKYFALRYEIYQLVQLPTNNQLEIIRKINECTTIYFDDGELWNLQLLDLLDRTSGKPESKKDQELFKTLINRIKSMPTNPTSEFLIYYYDSSIQRKKMIWNRDNLAIPYELYSLLCGYIFFNTKEYASAFMLWKQLSIERKINMKAAFKQLLPKLPNEKKKECRQQLKIIQKNWVIEHPEEQEQRKLRWTTIRFIVSMTLVIAFFIYVIIGAQNDTESTKNTESQTTEELYTEETESKEKTEETTNSTEENKVYEQQDFSEQQWMNERFVNNYYSGNSQGQFKKYRETERQSFIQTYIKDDALKTALQEHASKEDDQIRKTSLFKFESDRSLALAITTTAVYYENQLLCIITSEKDTITGIYGEGWQELPENEFMDLLQKTQNNPERTLQVFIKNILYSKNIPENIITYQAYFTESVKDMIEKNQESIKIDKDKVWLVYSLNDKERTGYQIIYKISLTEEDLFITFDDQNRINHIYGNGWEQLDQSLETELNTYDLNYKLIGSIQQIAEK